MINIVLIDDNDDIRDLVIAFLPKESYSIFSTHSGKVGIDYIKNNPVDLLITDIVMPEINGLQVISKIITIKPNVKIMAISMGGIVSANQYLALATGLGAHKVLLKPFIQEDLLCALKELFPEA